MTASVKRPHGQAEEHPDSPDLKRHLSESLAALRIASATPAALGGSSGPGHPAADASHAAACSIPFGGAPRQQSAVFLQGNRPPLQQPSPPSSSFHMSALDEACSDADGEPEVAMTDEPQAAESRALVLYQQPPRTRGTLQLRRLRRTLPGVAPGACVEDDDAAAVRRSSDHRVKRRVLAVVPYRPAKRRLMIASPGPEESTPPPPPAVVRAPWSGPAPDAGDDANRPATDDADRCAADGALEMDFEFSS
jgi:hypothetical protein